MSLPFWIYSSHVLSPGTGDWVTSLQFRSCCSFIREKSITTTGLWGVLKGGLKIPPFLGRSFPSADLGLVTLVGTVDVLPILCVCLIVCVPGLLLFYLL